MLSFEQFQRFKALCNFLLPGLLEEERQQQDGANFASKEQLMLSFEQFQRFKVLGDFLLSVLMDFGRQQQDGATFASKEQLNQESVGDSRAALKRAIQNDDAIDDATGQSFGCVAGRWEEKEPVRGSSPRRGEEMECTHSFCAEMVEWSGRMMITRKLLF